MDLASYDVIKACLLLATPRHQLQQTYNRYSGSGVRLSNRRRRGPKKVPQKVLRKLVQQGKALRVGATNNPTRRNQEYKRLGKPYRGSQMLFAKTGNMMRAEDKLLSLRKPPLNDQQLSNAPAECGSIYLWRKNNARANLAKKRRRVLKRAFAYDRV